MRDGMEVLKLRALDTGRPASYANWRLTTKAALACRSDDPRLQKYIDLIEDLSVQGALLEEGVSGVPGLRVVDKMLYSAVLDCVEGARKDEVLDELRTTVTFGSGRFAMRRLGRKFQQAGARTRSQRPRSCWRWRPRARVLPPSTPSC